MRCRDEDAGISFSREIAFEGRRRKCLCTLIVWFGRRGPYLFNTHSTYYMPDILQMLTHLIFTTTSHPYFTVVDSEARLAQLVSGRRGFHPRSLGPAVSLRAGHQSSSSLIGWEGVRKMSWEGGGPGRGDSVQFNFDALLLYYLFSFTHSFMCSLNKY